MLREVSLVAPAEEGPGAEIDLMSESECVALGEWSGAGVSWRQMVEVEAMRAVLVEDVTWCDERWVRRVWI